MKRLLSCLAALGLLASAPTAKADVPDPIGDLIARAASALPAEAAKIPAEAVLHLEARLYHGGGRGIRALDSLGCRVAAMRTLAVDPTVIPRRTVVFIKETVGMMMPGGRVHDGYWYASDIGGGIRGSKVDLFTGQGAGSMKTLAGLNGAHLSVTRVGAFTGCPPEA